MSPARLPREIAEAREARRELGLALDAPVSDLLDTIEGRAGVPVTIAALPTGFAGVMRRDRDQAYIFVNGAEPHVRQRFTLAHEFAHYRLGHASVYDTTDDMFGRDPQEMQANAFAGEFLVPRPAVDAWLEREGDPKCDINVVVRIARQFGVSADVSRIRLERAGRLRGAAKAAVQEAIHSGEHRQLHYMLSLGEFHDSLSAINASALPRLPAIAQRQIKATYAAGLATIEEIAARTGQAAEHVAVELADVQVVEEDPDF